MIEQVREKYIYLVFFYGKKNIRETRLTGSGNKENKMIVGKLKEKYIYFFFTYI